MGYIVKRVAVAVVLLALLAVAGCGEGEPAQPAQEAAGRSSGEPSDAWKEWYERNKADIEELKSPLKSAPSWAKVAPEQIAEAKKHAVPVKFENDLGMRFVLIPAGTFLMGSPEDEEDRYHSETLHEVTLTKTTYVQISEVTNAQYRRFKPDHDSGADNGDRRPVVRVSWGDAAAFAGWLSATEGGRLYRLPTDAEWERACRAGTATPFAFGANLDAAGGRVRRQEDVRSAAATAGLPPIGIFPPNPWGLYDMHRGVSEWCFDVWISDLGSEAATDPFVASTMLEIARVSRGGSTDGWTTFARSASRADRYNEAARESWRGFRLVCPLHGRPSPANRTAAALAAECLARVVELGERGGRVMAEMMWRGGAEPPAWYREREAAWGRSHPARRAWAKRAGEVRARLEKVAVDLLIRGLPIAEVDPGATQGDLRLAGSLLAEGQRLLDERK